MPEDEEDLRIKALREELLREVESVKSEVKNVKWTFSVLITVFGIIAVILTFAANFM